MRLSPAIALPPLLAALAGCASFPPQHPAKPPALAAIIPPPKFFLAKTAPPPAPGSPTVTRQVAEVIALQSRATPEKIAEARWTYDLSVFTFSVALDPSFTAKRYPQTAKFFMELNDLVEYVNDDLKDTFRNPHPFQVDPRIKRFVIAIPGYGYPSYHAARCALFERVLAQLDPARAAAFARVSDMVEADRVFAGEHFPYSIAAGRELGRQIFDELEKNAAFRASVVQLRQAEWTPPPSARDSFSRSRDDAAGRARAAQPGARPACTQPRRSLAPCGVLDGEAYGWANTTRRTGSLSPAARAVRGPPLPEREPPLCRTGLRATSSMQEP